MKAFLMGLLAFTMITITGCLGLQKVNMSAADRAVVKTIKVRADDRLPPLAYPNKAHAVGGAIAGPAGAIVAGAIAGDPAEKLLEIMKTNKIHLPSILSGECSQTMQSQGWTIVDLNSPADAEMVLIVNQYGLSSPPLSSVLQPRLHVSASLRKSDGTVIWQQNAHTKISDGSSFEAYAEHPEFLRDVWVKAARVVSSQLIAQGLFPLP